MTVLPHEVDHVRPLKHAGLTLPDNLCWSCSLCNVFKGSDVAGFDPTTQALTPLFNPRTDDWTEHFVWNGPTLQGKTAVGRTTVEVLRINQIDRVELRRELIESEK
jgi:hypothetical protein